MTKFRPRQREAVVSPNAALLTGRNALTLAGWLAIAAGLLNVVIAFLAYHPFRLQALWFTGTAVGFILIGVVTLGARNAAPGSMERWVAVATRGNLMVPTATRQRSAPAWT